jgi:hypothetical protein
MRISIPLKVKSLSLAEMGCQNRVWRAVSQFDCHPERGVPAMRVEDLASPMNGIEILRYAQNDSVK